MVVTQMIPDDQAFKNTRHAQTSQRVDNSGNSCINVKRIMYDTILYMTHTL